MKLCLAILFSIALCASAIGQNYSQVNLTWLAASNQVPGTPFQVWYGSSASHAYSGHWQAWSNQFKVTAPMLPQGMNYIAITQISTNTDGSVEDVSAFSGEVQIQEMPVGVVTAQSTNLELETSTDLGQSWQVTGTNQVFVPYSEKAQAFYRARANLTVNITTTNVMQILGGPQ